MCQFPHLLISKTSLLALAFALDTSRPATRHRLNNHALIAKSPLDNLSTDSIDDEMIGIDRPRHHRLPQSRTGVDHRLATSSGERIRGKEHTCYRNIDHTLNDDREANTAWINLVTHAITHGTVGPQRGPTPSYRIQQGILTNDV